MLASLRRFAGTWPARILFVVLVASFGLWGVADVARNLLTGTDPNSVATVGSRSISPAELQDVSGRMVAQFQRATGSPTPPSPEQRRGIVTEALDSLVVQASLAAEAARLRVSVSNDALRDAVATNKAFQGPDGRFNRGLFASILRTNNLTETRYLALLRTDLAQRQIVETVRAAAAAPDAVLHPLYSYEAETRMADLVRLPFAGAAEPPAPTEQQLQRQYDDNALEYRAPEYRRIKLVVLSPEGLAKDITVPDADAKTYYDSHQADFVRPDTRSVQVIVAPTQALGTALATEWTKGADWAAMQKQAAADGAAAVELNSTTQAAFPAPDLAAKVFAAAPLAVTGPDQASGGWAVFRVAQDSLGGSQTFDAEKAMIKARMALDQATDQVYDRANKVQDALAAGSALDELPQGLGLAAVTGTLDAQGDTPGGGPAPIPGGPALRQAIISRAFAVHPGDQPTLDEGPDHSFYAVSVQSITPPAALPIDQIRDRVRQDWLSEARRKEQDVAATALLTAVQSGHSLKAAAAAAKLPVTAIGPVGRRGVLDAPSSLLGPLFATPRGQATMVVTATGYVVAVPTAITRPDAAASPPALQRLSQASAVSIGNDLELTLDVALRQREHVTVNRQLLESVAQ